jgi:hypothetical protein
MAHQQSAELTEPGVGAFDDPAALVSSELTSILVLPQLVVGPIGHDQLDTSLAKPFTQRVGVVGAVSDHTLRLLPRTSFGTGDFDLGERGFGKRNLGSPQKTDI